MLFLLNRFPTNQQKSRQGDHSNFEFPGCESMQGSPRGGGRRPSPLGDHLHSLSKTREFENSSDRLVLIFWIVSEICPKQEIGETEHDRKPEKPKPRLFISRTALAAVKSDAKTGASAPRLMIFRVQNDLINVT